MTAPRPIRPIDGNALVSDLRDIMDKLKVKGAEARYGTVKDVIAMIEFAPTLPQPEPDSKPHEFGGFNGDAISRKLLLDHIANESTCKAFPTFKDLAKCVEGCPALTSAQSEP